MSSMYESEIQATLRGVDWRWSEVLDLAPVAIMQELLELDTVILDLFHAYREAKRDLAKAQEDLKVVEDAAVEEAQAKDDLNKGEPGYVPLVDGSNQTVRDRKARVYLSAHPVVKEARQEVERLATVADDAEGALDAMKDRQSNLRQWSRMYVATTELLTSMRPQGEEVTLTAYEIAEIYRESHPSVPDEGLAETILNQLAPPDEEPNHGDVAASREEPYPSDVADAIARYQDVAL